MKKLIMAGLMVSILALSACTNNTENVTKEEPVVEDTTKSSFSYNVLTKEDIGFHHAINLGSAVFHIDTEESLEQLWKEYELNIDKPDFNSGKQYYLLTFGHGGCTQEVENVSVNGNTMDVSLTDVSQQMCTMQYISRSTIIEANHEAGAVKDYNFEGNSSELNKLSELLTEVKNATE